MTKAPSMSEADYGHFIGKLAKDPALIREALSLQQIHLWHAATGVSGEAGELLDAVKKYAVYNKPLDRKNVIEELGDLEFYMEMIRQTIHVTRDECVIANVEKLRKRFHSGSYSDQQAQLRADKENGK